MSERTYREGLEGIELWDPLRIIGADRFTNKDLEENQQGLRDRARIEAESKAREREKNENK